MPYPPISALPTPPSRNSPSNFSALMDAFLAAFPQFRSEVNALAAYLDTLSLQAGATIASSPTDATLGRLPVHMNYPNQTGTGLPWGLGSSHAVNVPDNDANAITRAGFYRVGSSSTVANVPDTAFGGVILHIPYSATYSAQTYIMTNGGTAGLMWIRHCNNGTWAAWRRVYTQGDAVGTVSQSGGVPTGALIERGSNANGEYVRFADGTQICWKKLTGLGPISTAAGSVFASSEINVGNYAATFSAVPTCGFSTHVTTDGLSSWSAGANVPTTSVFPRAFLYRPTSNANTDFALSAIAIGRWF